MRPERRKRGVRAFVIALVTVALLAGSLPPASGLEPGSRRLYLAGDSWAAFLGSVAPQALASAGLDNVDVRNAATFGATTASFVASDLAGLAGDVASCDDLVIDPHPVVVLSLGGNDVVDAGQAMQGGFSEAALAALLDSEITPNLEEIVTRLVDAVEAATTSCAGLEEEPSVTIVLTDYDILNFGPDSPGPDCADFAYSIVGQMLSTSPPTAPIPAEGNRFMRELAARYAAVAAGHPEVEAADLQGTLQGSPGAPDLDRWSPPGLLTDTDCIHLNAAGFTTYFEALLSTIEPFLGRVESGVATSAVGAATTATPAAPAAPVPAQPTFTG